MSLSKEHGFMLIGASAGFSLGVSAGFILAQFIIKKKLESKYLAISNTEIAEAKKFYSVLNKKDAFNSPESAVEALGLDEVVVVDEETSTEAVEALKLYQGVEVNSIDVMESLPGFVEVVQNDIPENPPEEIHHNIFTDAEDESGWDYEEEMKNRVENLPYVIHHDEFMEAEPGYNQVTVTFYEGDDVLTDEKDQPIDDVEHTVGEENLLRFGEGSNDPNIVYIRNEVLDLDFEVIHSDGKYVEQVLGFIEHADHRRKIRRFRGDDE